MGKVLITMLMVVFVFSCSRTIYQEHLRKAIDYCTDKEGVFSLKIMDTNEVFMTCKNGERKQINKK